MSRTIRRRHGLGKHAWWLEREYDPEIGCYRPYTEEELEEKVRYLHSEKYEPMNNPSWFNHMFVEKPMRQHVRKLVHKTLLLEDLEDAPLFPGRRGPVIYFW